MFVNGFDWDKGNDPKVFKHGVTRTQLEEVFRSEPYVAPDVSHSDIEERFRAVGRLKDGRYVFVVFTFRLRDSKTLIRPISARFMHGKEISVYEKAISENENRS
jgi:uncharacterized DUF497 family protein